MKNTSTIHTMNLGKHINVCYDSLVMIVIHLDIKMWLKPEIRITTVSILAQYMFCFIIMISTSEILTLNGGKNSLK